MCPRGALRGIRATDRRRDRPPDAMQCLKEESRCSRREKNGVAGEWGLIQAAGARGKGRKRNACDLHATHSALRMNVRDRALF